MLIQDIILEIKNYKNNSIHKSAMDIYRLLEGNKALFFNKINDNNFNHLITNFEKLAYENPKEYNSPAYEREFRSLYDLLLFYLDRIV